QPAFVSDTGAPRPTYAVRGFDGGALLASDGGVIAVGSGEPIFHAAAGTTAPARLARVGVGRTPEGTGRHETVPRTRQAGVAMCGPNAWIWAYGPEAVASSERKPRVEGGGARNTSAEPPTATPSATELRADAFWVIDLRDW